jgi:hypothetical protein
MNVFYLNEDPVKCAEEHCDKHVVKMVIEYAQLLSTAHRVNDGIEYSELTPKGRMVKRWLLRDSRETKLYKAAHVNHPDAIWARKSCGNYNYLYKLFVATCDEYTKRYGKVHETDRKLRNILALEPENIKCDKFVEPPQCMPDHCKDSNTIQAYKNYYILEKAKFAKWKNNIPEWFNNAFI